MPYGTMDRRGPGLSKVCLRDEKPYFSSGRVSFWFYVRYFWQASFYNSNIENFQN